MSKEKDLILGHGDECDGIEEYDNALPAWWLGLFYFTIAWAVVYAVNYHFVANDSQAALYDAEMAAAAEQWPQQEITQVSAADITEDAVDAGKAVYDANCVACHGPNLEGGIGPNLKDSEWVHGGTLTDITRTITEGVPEKGMLTWGPILGPQKIAQVASFVYSAGGGVPDAAGTPEGEK
ncbi:MAG: c-type cytochrome [Alphaproteobacteria bacterium]|nr:c-type cytochrome [Alphaproteobacteria bacterium]